MPINAKYPTPQADRLDKVAVVTAAVAAGVSTSIGVAKTLDMVERQGSYYMSAACFLGLVELSAGAAGEYRLTVEGAAYQEKSVEDRIIYLGQLVSSMPATKIYLDSGLEGVTKLYQEAGLDSETSRRRAQTVASWSEAVDKDSLSADDIRADAEAVRLAAPAVAKYERASRRSVPVPPVGAACPSCFMSLPLTGICDDCS